MDIETIFPSTVFSIGPVPVSNTIVQTWIVVAVLALLATLAFRRFRVWQPRQWQVAIEYLVDYVENLVVDSGGRAAPDLVSYLTTMISFVAIANLLGLFPLFNSPTRDLNTTVALALVSLVSTHYFTIKRRGLAQDIKRFVEPVAFMLPLNLISEFSRVLSMSLRLFGNVVAGEIISAVMFALVPLLSPLVMNLLGMITSVLQALVFTVLTLVFTLDAIGSQEAATEKEI